MPWIQLARPQQLFVAQAADVVLYQKSKRAKGQSTWQPLVTFRDHQGDVSKFVIVEGQLVTCSRDKSIRTWSLMTGLCDGLYLGHSSDVHSVDCIGEVIVTGSQDKTVKVQSGFKTLKVLAFRLSLKVLEFQLNKIENIWF